MIAVDTNILVYAHRAELPWHGRAAVKLTELLEGPEPWGLPWPCVHEFYAKVTHAKLFPQPTPPAVALDFLGEVMRVPGVRVLGEADGYMELLDEIIRASRVVGPMVHDARIAALCLLHGVNALWTADRDFGRFPRLRTVNPLVD